MSHLCVPANRLNPCSRCGAAVGELHEYCCESEQCLECGGQLQSCGLYRGCVMDRVPDRDRLPWTGLEPCEAECLEFGWYWPLPAGVAEPADEPYLDINRLYGEAAWDRARRRFVRTTLTRAGQRLREQGIRWSCTSRVQHGRTYSLRAQYLDSHGVDHPVVGFASLIFRGAIRPGEGKDFRIAFARQRDPETGQLGLEMAEIGTLIGKTLTEHGIEWAWGGNPRTRIRVKAKSVKSID
jgi:hypothetical protein